MAAMKPAAISRAVGRSERSSKASGNHLENGLVCLIEAIVELHHGYLLR